MVGPKELERLGRLRDPLLGTVVNGRFRIDRPLARGGMGRIYHGTQTRLDRPVALKVLTAEDEDESRFVERFMLEASILAKLQHPNVVTIFDYGRVVGAAVDTYFIAMELIDGETLGARLRARGALPTPEVVELVRQIGRGLREAHAIGIIHRDLKPSNVVVANQGGDRPIHAKLIDFGVGKLELGGTGLTRHGVLVGTPKYMAPEQFDAICSSASDVYALGLLAFTMLAGALPFAGDTLAELMVAKMQRPLRSLRDVNPSCAVPRPLEDLLACMLARRPNERPSIDAILGELDHWERVGIVPPLRATSPKSSARVRVSATGHRPGIVHPPAPLAPVAALQPVGSAVPAPLVTNRRWPPRAGAVVVPPPPPAPARSVPSLPARKGIAGRPGPPPLPLAATRSQPPFATAAARDLAPPRAPSPPPSSRHVGRALHVQPPPPGQAAPPESAVVEATLTTEALSMLEGRARRTRSILVASILIGTLAVGAAAARVGKHDRGVRPSAAAHATLAPPRASASSSSVPAAAPATTATGAMPTPVPATTSTPAMPAPRSLHLATIPPGAVVAEDGKVLGLTPLDVRFDPNGATAPRRFELRKSGFATAALVEDSTAAADVERVVALAPGALATEPRSPRNLTTTTKAADALDIRLRR